MAEAIQMPLARCGEEFLIGKLATVLLQFALKILLLKYSAIDNTAWDLPVLNVKHCSDVGSAVSGEALIGPAKCVRRHDNVVECEKRIGRICRLLLENIEGRAGDPPACENVRESLLIDDWSARSIDEYSATFHQVEFAFANQVMSCGGIGCVDTDKIRLL